MYFYRRRASRVRTSPTLRRPRPPIRYLLPIHSLASVSALKLNRGGRCKMHRVCPQFWMEGHRHNRRTCARLYGRTRNRSHSGPCWMSSRLGTFQIDGPGEVAVYIGACFVVGGQGVEDVNEVRPAPLGPMCAMANAHHVCTAKAKCESAHTRDLTFAASPHLFQ